MRSTPNSTRRAAPRDYLVAASAGLTLAYAAWGLGGIPAWSLHVLLAGGITTLAFALFPWPKTRSAVLQPASSSSPQASTEKGVKHSESAPWVEATEAPLGIHLPTSIRADYQPMNAWRVLASFTAAFTLMWGLWAGLTPRPAN